MDNNTITCPYCNKKFALSKVITGQIENMLKKEHEKELNLQKKKYEDDLIKAQKELEKNISEKYEKRYEIDYKKIKADAIKKAKKELSEELADKDEEISEINKKLQSFKQKEIYLLKKERELEEAKHTMTVEFNDKLNKELKKVYSEAQSKVEEEFKLKLLEKEKIINDLNRQMKEGQKKAEQGSMQLQGEVLEMEIEDLLLKYFPDDSIEPVSVGKKGGDIIQTVKFPSGKNAGKILWELKRTKNWSTSWIAKLKEDQRQIHAEVSVIASEVLPSDINNFGLLEGVWITEIKYILGLATALRENLKSTALVKMANEGKSDKAEMVFNYLTGTQFKQRVESILEAYVEMQNDLDTEKRLLEKSWSKREKQIERFIRNISGMYGDLQGVGATLPSVKLLEIPE